MLTKIVATRIDNGWVIVEQGKEVDGTAFKHTKHVPDDKAAAKHFSLAIALDQTKLVPDKEPED